MNDIKLYKNKDTNIKFLLNKNDKGKFLRRALTEINKNSVETDRDSIIEKLYRSYMFKDKINLFLTIHSDMRINLKKLIGKDEIIYLKYNSSNNNILSVTSVHNFMHFRLKLYPKNPKALNKLLKYRNEDYMISSSINPNKFLEMNVIFDNYFDRHGHIDPAYSLNIFIEYVLEHIEVNYEGEFINFMDLLDILFNLAVEEVKDKKEFREYVVRKNFK